VIRGKCRGEPGPCRAAGERRLATGLGMACIGVDVPRVKGRDRDIAPRRPGQSPMPDTVCHPGRKQTLTMRTTRGCNTCSTASSRLVDKATIVRLPRNPAPYRQPQTNPKYRYPTPIYNFLALFEAPNHTLQLIENTLVTSLITQRSLVQIQLQPPQPNLSITYKI
jgi:hypothetical protein